MAQKLHYVQPGIQLSRHRFNRPSLHSPIDRQRSEVANFEVVAAVSETLRETLRAALNAVNVVPKPTAELHDLQFDTPPRDPQLTIFLFEIGEDPSARNRPRIRETEPPDIKIKKPPVALVLRYLLTAWGGTQPGDQRTPQLILGRAIQTLYDKAILSGPDLQGVLKDTDQALKVTMSPLSLEERTRVWHAVQKPYRLSVSYEVRVVNLDSEIDTSFKPVGRRRLDFDELEAS
jgi:Pvc16 N-terminal domain